MKYKQNDYELLYLVSQQDEEAKKVLYQKYGGILANLTKLVYQRYKNMNGFEYQDFYQEACYGFEKAIETYDEKRNILFYTYATSCIRNQLASYSKTITRKKDYPLNYAFSLNQEMEVGGEYQDLIPDNQLTPYEVCEDQDYANRIRTFQNNLIFLDACIFELRYNGFCYKEIASLLDISEHRVSYGLHRIKEKASFLS